MMIQKIPAELFDQGYTHFSFDVTSLFTNVPLNKTINIILERIYKEKLINAKLLKNALFFKKIVVRKPHFPLMEVFCKQKDEVSRGLSLAPFLPNIIIAELEKLGTINKIW